MGIRILSLSGESFVGVTLFVVNHDSKSACDIKCLFRDDYYYKCSYKLIKSNSSTASLLKEISKSTPKFEGMTIPSDFRLCDEINDKDERLIIDRRYNYIIHTLPSSVSLYISAFINKRRNEIESFAKHIENDM